MTRRRFKARYEHPQRYNTGMKRRAGVVNPFSLVARVTLRRRPLRHLRHRRIRGLGGGPPRDRLMDCFAAATFLFLLQRRASRGW